MTDPKHTGGDCYYVALMAIMDKDDDSGYMLCHGEPIGQGPIEGIKHGHAWLEQELPGLTIVIDRSNGKDLMLPTEIYYEIGRIYDKEVVRYLPSEVRRMVVRHEHAGPWHEENTDD